MSNINFDDDFTPFQGGETPIYEFSSVIAYAMTKFGLVNPHVEVYSLSLNAKQLYDEFVIFEQIPNVESWPVSKLIQRELNYERAQRICDDYLLKNSGIKYFPPLTAVLIPTDDLHQPRDGYEAADPKETEALKVKYSNLDWPVLNAYSAVRGLSAIRRNPTSTTGGLVWDKRKLSAVIIDGQHRYKALMLARKKNKGYDEFSVSVNLVDLAEFSSLTSQSPTTVARDLFVTINNTPVEVDEARLVLMDDKESFSTFTQVLVDDSDKVNGPAVRPELIDWRCEQGKHDSGIALTGVLTLWSTLSFSICKGRAMASIEDRLSESIVKKWCDSMDAWLDANNCLESSLGPSETLKSRLKQASAADNSSGPDEASPFLFSYSLPAAEVLRGEFKRRYGCTFKMIFEKLAPYQYFQDIAKKNKAFDPSSKLHSYLRSFRARREELYSKDGTTTNAVDIYKNELAGLTANRLLYTVMGQKAIFYTLFNSYLSTLDNLSDPASIKLSVNEFISTFNNKHDLLQLTPSVVDDFFSTKFRPKYARKVIPTAGKACGDFWKGIIVKVNDELDYGDPATKILASIFLDILTYDGRANFEFSSRMQILKRHSRIMILSGLAEDDAESIAEQVVAAKELVLKRLLSVKSV